MQKHFQADEVARFENETWSRCARGYMEGFGLLVAEAIPRLLDEVNVGPGKRVLDVGTGPGLAAAAAAELGAHVVGIDFSEDMLLEARRLHPEIEFRLASAESLPFEDDQFDAVIGNFVLHHSGRPQQVLEEAYRVLRRGAKTGFTVWADISKLEAFGLFFAAVEEHAGSADLPHGPLFGVSDFEVFRRMARDAGFGKAVVTELAIAWPMRTIDTLLGAFRDWADLTSLPSEVQTAIENTVRDRAIAQRFDDVFTLPNPAILLSAVKGDDDCV